MGKAQPSPAVERFGNLELPLGSGIHRYVGVRKVRNGQFQGYTPKKTHTTKACSSAHEAAVLRAQEKFNVQNFGEATKRKRSAARKSRWEGKLLTCPLPSHTLRAHDFMWLDSCRAAGAFGCQEAQGRRDERVRDEPAAHSFAGVPDYTRAGGVTLRVRPSARACRAHGMSIVPYNPGVSEHHPCLRQYAVPMWTHALPANGEAVHASAFAFVCMYVCMYRVWLACLSIVVRQIVCRVCRGQYCKIGPAACI